MKLSTWQFILAALIVLGASVCPAQASNGGSPDAGAATTPAKAGAGTQASSPTAASGDPQKATDDSNKVETAVAAASTLIDDAGKYQKTIAGITMPSAKSTQPSLDDLQQLETAVDAISRSKLIDNLNDAKKNLTSAESTRNTDCSALSQPATGAQQDVTDALAKCTKAGKDAKDKSASLDTALSGLQTTLASISPYLADQFDALAGTLKSFVDAKLIPAPGAAADATPPTGGADASVSKPATDPNAAKADANAAKSATPNAPSPTVLLQVLPKGLPALKHVLGSIGEYTAAWNTMKPAVQAAAGPKANAPAAADKTAADQTAAANKDAAAAKSATPDADTELKNLQGAIGNIEVKLATWFPIISGQLTADAQTLDGKLAGVATDPAKNSAEALGDVRDKTDTLAAVQSIVDAWPPLVGFLVDGQPTGFSLSSTRKSFEDMQKWTNTLRASISRVHDALAGDFSDFETDQVSLYYFTDVQRLMYVLNEGFQTLGGVAEAQAQAAAQRTALTKTELDLADAQATVNRYQKQVLDLQEQQRQANEKLKGLNSNLSKLASRLQQAQKAKQDADQAVTTATQNEQPSASSPGGQSGASTTSAPDPTLAADLTQAQAKQTTAAANLSTAQSNYNAAKTDRDNAQAQADGTQDQADSLPAKLAAAQQALSDAQTAVSAERRKMLLAAQAESDAFAFARDNAPFMVAFADASSSNPAKRVMLYAFNDSKTIFMRGKRADLDEVKRIIAEFDQPAPQARLTLWTFELSAEAGQKANKGAAKKLNASMGIVDEELSDIRALQNTTLTLLRDLINEKVRQSAPPNPLPSCRDCAPADLQKLNRLGFFDPLVLERLTSAAGATGDKPLDVKVLRGEIPDPAATTTLGEALMVLSLAPAATRKEIRDSFETQILDRLRALPISEQVKAQTGLSAMTSCGVGGDQGCFLPLTWHALAIWERAPVAGLTSQQLEITHALKTAYENAKLLEAIRKMQAWFDELPTLNSRIAAVQRNLASWEDKAAQKQPRPATAETESDKTARVLSGLTSAADQLAYRQQLAQSMMLQARLQTIEQGSVKVVKELKSRGYDVGDILSKASVNNLDDAYALSSGEMQDVKSALTPVLSEATPSEAAADEMLKAMIIAIEDDLDRIFLQPMIQGLRERLIADTGVNVGIMQRESMLATNRGKARVDPRASAQLAVGEEEDILAGVQQLAQLYGAVQSGGALGALGALEQLPREPQPEIYALTTGNKFEVTPIFDPSGQALRFKFDFVGSSNLQEPNGTTNPQFPRIERHTVNTEVQLSNLETREISRFESDSRLGLPTQYSGGIPILKDIPYVRPWIPLIGWFVRKAGSNAVAQQSVIFGQTTIYPSIQTMVSLLEDSETGPT
jgi:hypothetical protein